MNTRSITVDISKELSKDAIETSQLEKKLAQKFRSSAPTQSKAKKQLDFTSDSKVEGFYTHEQADRENRADQPWRKDPHYFNKAHISLKALLKMTTHARNGGPLEIMGMLTGKYIGQEIIVTDCFPLPVHGTESRVNPVNDAYEFMLQYLSQLQESPTRKEHVIGWYHSHPAFGCWLSGIDVQTQRLNQNFQDPYVAIVVDPEQTMRQKMVEIGCFRTYYEDNHPPQQNKALSSVGGKRLSAKKLKDFGFHANEYYAMDVDVFKNANDEQVLSQLENRLWYSELSFREDERSAAQFDESQKQIEEQLPNILDKHEPDAEAMSRSPSVNKMRRFNRTLNELSSPYLAVSSTEVKDDYQEIHAEEVAEEMAVKALKDYLRRDTLYSIF